jgi:hypothetical protein
MNHTILNNAFRYLGLGILILVLFSSFQSAEPILLKDEPIELKEQNFYVAELTDQTGNKGHVAELVRKLPGSKISIATSNLQGGAESAITKYLLRNLPINKSLFPISIQIKDLKITETAGADGRISGQINLALDFGLQKDYGFEHLVDYPGRLHYQRSLDNSAAVERNLRSMLKGGLVYLNDWIIDHAATSRKLAKSVKISFGDYREKTEGDTIYYSLDRKLSWADFQSKLTPSGPYQASVMPSIGYTEDARIDQGVIKVKILLKAYLPKSASWANYSGRDDYALNHEQRHFDIVKIISEQFKKKVMSKKLSPDNYEAFINMQYLDCFRDMNTMQEAYDGETAHGQNRFAQEKWNLRIDQELKSTVD